MSKTNDAYMNNKTMHEWMDVKLLTIWLIFVSMNEDEKAIQLCLLIFTSTLH